MKGSGESNVHNASQYANQRYRKAESGDSRELCAMVSRCVQRSRRNDHSRLVPSSESLRRILCPMLLDKISSKSNTRSGSSQSWRLTEQMCLFQKTQKSLLLWRFDLILEFLLTSSWRRVSHALLFGHAQTPSRYLLPGMLSA